MSVLQSLERPALAPRAEPRSAEFHAFAETVRSIALAWESIAEGSWSTAAVQSFAVLARGSALELSALGCGTLDGAVVELALALDALTLAGAVSAQHVERVDYAIAQLRAVTTGRLLALALPSGAPAGECPPALGVEPCARCARGVCVLTRRGSS